MPILFVILSAVFAANLAWWKWADRRLARVKSGKTWRMVLAIFTLGQILYLSVLVFPKISHSIQRWVPVPVTAGIYLWSLLMLPVTLVGIGIAKLGARARNSMVAPVQHSGSVGSISRRRVLGAAAVAVPPLITSGLVLRSVGQLSRFRVRSMRLNVPQLPAKLDGMRIAHFSDLHVGRYTRPGQIPAMVDAVNRLGADLVLFTGDLIDMSLLDLPRGIDAMKAIDPRQGFAMIEGNHDLIDNADEFDRRVKAAGLPLLIDQAITVNVRGQPVQLLGTRWGESTGNRRRASDAAFAASIEKLNSLRDPTAFPILLAHHPHTFDAAATAGFPLVLSGHTHGGQLMLNSKVGFGPLFFRYWSGLYAKNHCQMVVNNGVGNWFPLRVNAPAEIIELTLQRQA
jgi:predicted MPP superfamily phosphohydrolase